MTSVRRPMVSTLLRLQPLWWSAVVVAACAMVAVVAHAQPVFRSGTNLVMLRVAVMDDHQQHVRDLRREDFAVFEQGVRQVVSVFAADTAPIDLLLLLDTSDSMLERTAVARRIGLDLVGRLGRRDRAAVVLFNQRARLASAITGDRAGLVRAIQRAPSGGGTVLRDGLALAIEHLASAHSSGAARRRRAIVVVSDGHDSASQVTVAELAVRARDVGVTIYTVVPPEGVPIAPTLGDPEPSAELNALAGDSGGRAFVLQDRGEIGRAGAWISADLTHQYWLGYVPTTRADRQGAVDVRVVAAPRSRNGSPHGYRTTWLSAH